MIIYNYAHFATYNLHYDDKWEHDELRKAQKLNGRERERRCNEKDGRQRLRRGERRCMTGTEVPASDSASVSFCDS